MNEKLLMQIGLIDQVTKPLRGITRQIDQTMQTSKQGMRDMVTGGAGLVATGFAIQNALMPAIEMDRKIGEVKSLGVTVDALKTLSQTALEFSSEYGKSATEFVDASYDIQSAIAGLNGDELSQFTKASGVLAAATKADTKTITSYMGTMYGIFKNQANEMGKGEWVEQVAGMTASAVQMFKTTGSEMSRAFTAVGADATSAGVAMNEQMAVLGTLQATMSGSEAGTKYRAFLNGVAKAQDALNLKFTDSQGAMLPMLDILEKLKGRYGDTIDVAESAELQKAFGTKEASAMIKLLMTDTDGLAKSINSLGQVKGMSKAEQMASAMTDQWERLEASWFAIRAAAFGTILPSMNAIAGSIANGMTWLTGMTDEFPILTQVMSYAAIGAISLGGVVAALSLAMGIGRMMSSGWAVTMGMLNGVLRLGRLSLMAFTGATWLMNAAFWANPVTWVVAGVAALVGAVAAAIIYWDDLKASFGDLTVFKMLTDVIDWVIQKLNLIPGVDIEWRAGDMPEMKNVTDTQGITKSIPDAANDPAYRAAKTARDTSVTPVPEAAYNVVNSPVYQAMPMTMVYPLKQSMDNRTQSQYLSQNQTTNQNFAPSVIDYKKPEREPKLAASVVKNMTTNQHHESSNIRQFGDVYITTPDGLTPDQLAEWEELNAG